MTARMTESAMKKAKTKQMYASAFTRSELHSMLDTLIDSGRQWLVELHFSAWVSANRTTPRSEDSAHELIESTGSY